MKSDIICVLARTIHTLYAISFIVYSINCAFDWWHVVVTVRDGDTVSYPLHTWLMTTMVGCVVVGRVFPFGQFGKRDLYRYNTDRPVARVMHRECIRRASSIDDTRSYGHRDHR